LARSVVHIGLTFIAPDLMTVKVPNLRSHPKSVAKRMPFLPTPSHHHKYIGGKIPRKMGGKNDMVDKPTLLNIATVDIGGV
jgi:hypothetical protein